MAVIGYVRVSTLEQHLDLQRDALMRAGCDRIFEDQGISAVAKHRPGFQRALEEMVAGDVFVIWKMDRAFRSLRNALDTLEQLERKGIEFKCLTEAIDTSTSMGKCMYQVRNAFAELERNFIRERTIAGIEAARKRGKVIGRPQKLNTEQVESIRHVLAREPGVTRATIAKSYGVSLSTLHRALNGR